VPKGQVTTDALCLAAITAVSALTYLPHLGFYSDDWNNLARFSAAPHTSLGALLAESASRPVQGLYFGLLFKLFGLDPLGYHIVNTVLLSVSIGLLYLLLVRLRFGRVQAFATSLIFAMLPQLSTVRVWNAASQVTLSLALTLVCLHCQLSFARSGNLRWLAGGIAAAILSIGAYEIFAPLIAGFALALIVEASWRSRTANGGVGRRPASAGILLVVLMLLALVSKLALSERAGHIADPRRYLLGLRQLVRLDYDWRFDSGLNIIATPSAYFLAPIRGWSTGASALFSGQPRLEVAVTAILIAALGWWRLASAKQGSETGAPQRLLLTGIATFLLGNATFLIVPAVVFTSTGMDNRVQIAAAIGVAMIFASLLGLAVRVVPQHHQGVIFSTVVLVVTASAYVRLSSIEAYWAQAPAIQQRVFSAARADLGTVPANSTVILDGVCPYFGPAVVLETSWDVGGALTLALGRSLKGDAVSPRMSPTASGLQTSFYKEPRFYPYGPMLFIYNPVKRQLTRVTDAATAVRYFRTRRSAACPGLVARGMEV
jgi:hypothetical protein